MKPVDAASLVIVRDRREVLMGLRSSRHVFAPQQYVFPGGRVDAGDSRVPAPFTLPVPVQRRLSRSVTAARGRGIAMAAVRETWEETGLLLARPLASPLRTRSPGWRSFYNKGLAPALDRVSYFARAITPPNNVRRFDARFFVADACHCVGSLRGNGELENLHWVSFADADNLPMFGITRAVLSLVRCALDTAPVPGTAPEVAPEVIERELVEQHPVTLPST
ncbi:NUDIX domain-containing protein [Parahaliea maris]|uniref:NUDIX domain-containing protein n=1 Tax=Parahaliea maris TaxID=2716870 RepID=A0A5C9A3M6_9GAMM|nr:NUDIX domain-containing protein [Parahaliea maris]TXS94227.1 NUDIX domain-containing protein [Parahaliea maris]